ncbi:MAG TPA: response regulator [Methanocorpusculum sp.]|nr:response regulator [Methanocorpusculum sp.]
MNNTDKTHQNPIILVIDDDFVTRTIVSASLKKQYTVFTAESANAAGEILREQIPDLILLDISMPETDGFAFFASLQKNPLTADIPVIYLTGDDSPETEISCLSTGAMDYIKKPPLIAVLRTRIAHALELTSLRKAVEQEVKTQTLLAQNKTELTYSCIKESEKLIRGITNIITAAVENKGNTAKGTTRKTAAAAAAIAGILGKTGSEIQEIYLASLYYDIGMITVPDTLLAKPEKNEIEELIIQNHTTAGAALLENTGSLSRFARIAKYHHEKWDGTGYPEGLEGKNIPETAQIIAAAEIYTAFSASGTPADTVTKTVLTLSGTTLDPRIANALLALIENGSLSQPHETRTISGEAS